MPGDRLLVAVGGRLRAAPGPATRSPAWVATSSRSSLEETDPSEAAQAATRILQALASPFDLGGREIVARASIGIAIRTADGGDADELLRRADIAMYAAKARGGECHVTFEPSWYDATVARMELKADLHGALERGEFHVVYQPIVDLDSGAIWASRRSCAGIIRSAGRPADRVHPARRGDRAHPRSRPVDPRDSLPAIARLAGPDGPARLT